MPMALWMGCVCVCYAVFHFSAMILGPIGALLPAVAAIIGIFSVIRNQFRQSNEKFMDQSVYKL